MGQCTPYKKLHRYPLLQMVSNKTMIFCFCVPIFFGCGSPTKPGRQTPSFPPPHWQRPAIKGGFAINPPTADAPRGQYTLLVLHPQPLPPPPRLCQNTGGSEGLGGDRVSRHPSSTGLRFSPMATTPPPPPWVNIYFWQIQEAARRKSSLAGEMGFSLFVILQLPGPAPRDEPTITL